MRRSLFLLTVVLGLMSGGGAASADGPYAGLFNADLDTAADALDQRFSMTNTAPVRPERKADVISIDRTGV